MSRYIHPIDKITPNLNEVSQIKALSAKELKIMINDKNNKFSPWFVNIFNNKLDYILESLRKSEEKNFDKDYFEDNIKIRNDYNV